MSPDAATKLSSLTRRQFGEWLELLGDLKDSCEPAEFKKLQSAARKIAATRAVLESILPAERKFMSPEVAEKFLGLALRQSNEWNQLLIELQSSCEPTEFNKLKHVVGTILATYYDEVLKPVLTEHPHLSPPELEGLFKK